MTVTHQDHAAGEVELPIVVTVVDNKGADDMLLLSHYNSSATEGNKKLSSGYIDGSGVFQEETDSAKFPTANGKTNVFYSSLDIKAEVDFSVIYSTGTHAGWSGNAGNSAYDANTNPYSYEALPQYWTTAGGVSYSASDLLSDLASETVDVGIKKDSTLNRGRLFERYAMVGDVDYAYNDSGTEAARAAEASGGLSGYIKTATAVALTGIDSATVTVKDDLFYYAWGGATNTPQDDESNDVSVKFEAKVA